MYKVLEEAGLPPGVINFVPGKGRSVGDPVFASKDFAGLHFTGSTATFQAMWRTMAENLPAYGSYPRIVGETGGKDFIFAHPSADAKAVTTAIVRASFEYQGQKCSAASRAYIPKSLWSGIASDLKDQLAEMKMGSPMDFRNFLCAVIDKKAFDDISGYIDEAKNDSNYEVIAGGGCDDSVGYFIEPTVLSQVTPHMRVAQEEIFGPVVCVIPFDTEEEALHIANDVPFALGCSIWTRDVARAHRLARDVTAGIVWINDHHRLDPGVPWGGFKDSGYGREGSFDFIHEYTAPKYVCVRLDPQSVDWYGTTGPGQRLN